MSRRPVETGGSLVFQEGKKIEGEYYIIAVYDDPERNTVSFSAYELETNQTYTLPYTYTELDDLWAGRFFLQRLLLFTIMLSHWGSKTTSTAGVLTPSPCSRFDGHVLQYSGF